MGINQYIQIGSKIKEARLSKHISQKNMAEQLGLSVSTYSNYENNYREPKLETIEKICGILGITINELINTPEYAPENHMAKFYNPNGEIYKSNPPRFTTPMSNETNKAPTKLHNNSGVLNEEYLDDIKFNSIIQKKKRGDQLTAEEQIFHDAYLDRGLRQALESAIKFYFMLNDNGKKKADAQITQFIEQLELLTKIPEFQKATDNTDK